MSNLKSHVRSQRIAHVYVHCFEEIVHFESENKDYKMFSKCQSPRGHPLYRGTETLTIIKREWLKSKWTSSL